MMMRCLRPAFLATTHDSRARFAHESQSADSSPARLRGASDIVKGGVQG